MERDILKKALAIFSRTPKQKKPINHMNTFLCICR